MKLSKLTVIVCKYPPPPCLRPWTKLNFKSVAQTTWMGCVTEQAMLFVRYSINNAPKATNSTNSPDVQLRDSMWLG